MSENTIDLASMSAWDIAKHFGCHYTGDANPFQHGGTFYSLENWIPYGYADTVEIWQDPETGETVVSAGTVNRIDDAGPEICRTYGIDPEDVTLHHQFDYAKSQWGCETVEDFGGRYEERFPEDSDENEFWGEISGWLRGLSAE